MQREVRHRTASDKQITPPARPRAANADEVISILTAATPIKDADVYRRITPTGMNVDGRVNVLSPVDDMQFYREQGLIAGDVNLGELVDHSFVDAVVKELGPYKR
jgi:NitT/TauT family transport system substrate-binding protein